MEITTLIACQPARVRRSLVAISWIAFAGLAAGWIHADTPSNADSDQVDFNRDVRPILSNHCFACHGPDERSRQAGLRLDHPDEVDFSEVISRIMSDDESEVMPPPESNKPLSPSQVDVLRKWIDQGSPYEAHWAFNTPVKTDVPHEAHPIDFFVDRQLSEKGLVRSPAAHPAILIRRLYLDLIGLPPPIEVADKFIANPSPQIYETIVDQLLDSPRYGERWARRWLDLARYADTNGYEKDRDRSIWPYRDWVIRAINDDKPFDQFTIEQLAGDMLPGATPDQMIATGFHRNSMLNEEGGIDPLEYRYYAMVDRVATTGTTWLGMTIGCAQCHAHKFDPISHQEYFSLMAYLNNADEPDFFPDTDKAREKRASELQQANLLMAELEQHWPVSDNDDGPDLESAFSEWLKVERENVDKWKRISPSAMSTNLPFLTQEPDGIIFAAGDTTKHDIYSLEFPALDTRVTAIRLEALPDPRLPGGGPGMTFYEGRKGDFFLAEFALLPNDGPPVDWDKISETYANNRFGAHRVAAELATDGDFQSGWSVAGRQSFRHVAVFNLKKPLPAGTPFKISMEFGRHFASSLGKFRLSVANSTKPIRATNLLDRELNLLTKTNAPQNNALRERFLMQAPQLQEHANKIRDLLRTDRGVSTLVMKERPEGQQRKTYLHHRGDFTQPKQEVVPGLPAALKTSNQTTTPANRLEFARWLVSRNNPLTSRVVANRHWAAFFGTGLVPTLDDFGMQGAHPSHPELLDYLAVELMDRGWSIKSLHRLIVTSQTYQQSAKVNSSHNGLERWLPRFPRRRLEAEIIRDAALEAAGLLNRKMYGPPVRPPQPEGAAANFSQSKWRASQGIDRFRRSIYTYQKRTAPFEMFTTFDATSGEFCVARRDVSNTPLQALTLMNDPMFLEISEAYGQRMAKHDGSTSEKIQSGFRWLLTRKPAPEELDSILRFYETHRDWTAVARVLLCLDETITKN